MRDDPQKNPKVEVHRDDLVYAVNTLRMAGYDGETVQRLARVVDDSEPEGGPFGN